MKKKLFLALLLPLNLFPFNMQAAQPAEPQHCPSAASIISVGVSHNMVEDSDGLWFTGRRNQKYDTCNNWTFILAKISANSVNDAYSQAIGGLSTLVLSANGCVITKRQRTLQPLLFILRLREVSENNFLI